MINELTEIKKRYWTYLMEQDTQKPQEIEISADNIKRLQSAIRSPYRDVEWLIEEVGRLQKYEQTVNKIIKWYKWRRYTETTIADILTEDGHELP